jgi:hypothetical protein
MADGLGFTPGTGATIATDQGGVTGHHLQKVKLAFSADGEETPILADADGLEVQIGKSITLATSPLAGQAWPVTDNGGNLSVDDGAGSLTVDAPAATPVAVRLSTGAAFIDTIPVSDGASTLSVDDGAGSLTVDGTVTANQGTAAAVASGWPAKITDGTDTVGISTVGAAKALKVDVIQSAKPAETRVTKSVTLAAGETSTTIWDPDAGKKFVITDLILAMSESGRVTVFDGTDAAANRVFDGVVYGAVWHFNFQGQPWKSSTADNILKATTDADAEVTITVHGYEV